HLRRRAVSQRAVWPGHRGPGKKSRQGPRKVRRLRPLLPGDVPRQAWPRGQGEGLLRPGREMGRRTEGPVGAASRGVEGIPRRGGGRTGTLAEERTMTDGKRLPIRQESPGEAALARHEEMPLPGRTSRCA